MNVEALKVDIQKMFEDSATKLILDLKKQGLMQDGKHTTFQKTEQLLYNYMNFKAAIEDKHKHIDFIKRNGIQKKSKSITSFGGNTSFEVMTDSDKEQDQIESLEKSIIITKRYIEVIDDALSKNANDKYYDIIRMRYFEGQTREKIAEHFEVDVATISRNKNRLINLLKISLFSDDVIREIFR